MRRIQDILSGRRGVIAGSAAVAGAATMAGPFSLVKRAFGVTAPRSETLRVGLIGCGDRGSGAVVDALQADRNTRLVAMGDVFEDRLQRSLASLSRNETLGARID